METLNFAGLVPLEMEKFAQVCIGITGTTQMKIKTNCSITYSDN